MVAGIELVVTVPGVEVGVEAVPDVLENQHLVGDNQWAAIGETLMLGTQSESAAAEAVESPAGVEQEIPSAERLNHQLRSLQAAAEKDFAVETGYFEAETVHSEVGTEDFVVEIED